MTGADAPRALTALVELARAGRLYPAVILDGGAVEQRRQAALVLARALLCEIEPGARPCGACRHCRRIVWPQAEAAFHPDFAVLERDLKTVTSAAATKAFARLATQRPFEARAQVFVVATAETLSPEAADALLKLLEEPPTSVPRHFLLLAPSRRDLLPTLRSRSLAAYLGPSETLDPGRVAALADAFAAPFAAWLASGASVHLLAAAAVLGRGPGFEELRSTGGFTLAAAAVVEVAKRQPAHAARLLTFAASLLVATDLRLRAIGVERILEGLLVRHLVAEAPGPLQLR